jgi:hypothetical protein
MAIFAGSRYEGLSFTVLTEDSISKKFLHLRVPPSYVSTQQHELLPADTLDLLAYFYTGQARNWWRFCEANDLFWPLDIPQATRLDIPG